jgi:AcrR family transcriptional regulator
MDMKRLKAPQRREQLMTVATRLFAKSGYNATTTAAIAEAAGVTEPILYRHFRSKQELFVAIVQATTQQTLREWRRMIAGISDSAEQIRTIARAFPEHIHELEDAYRVLHGAMVTSRDRKVVAVLRDYFEQIEAFFCQIVAAGHKTGVFRRDLEPRVLAWQLIYAGTGYAMVVLNLAQSGDFSVEEAIDALLGGFQA